MGQTPLLSLIEYVMISINHIYKYIYFFDGYFDNFILRENVDSFRTGYHCNIPSDFVFTQLV